MWQNSVRACVRARAHVCVRACVRVTALPVLSAVIQLEFLPLHPSPAVFLQMSFYVFTFSPGFHLPLSPLSTCRSAHLDHVCVCMCVCVWCLSALGVCTLLCRTSRRDQPVSPTKSLSNSPLSFCMPLLFCASHSGHLQVAVEVKTGHQNGEGGERRGKWGWGRVTEDERCGSPPDEQPASQCLCVCLCEYVRKCLALVCIPQAPRWLDEERSEVWGGSTKMPLQWRSTNAGNSSAAAAGTLPRRLLLSPPLHLLSLLFSLPAQTQQLHGKLENLPVRKGRVLCAPLHLWGEKFLPPNCGDGTPQRCASSGPGWGEEKIWVLWHPFALFSHKGDPDLWRGLQERRETSGTGMQV